MIKRSSKKNIKKAAIKTSKRDVTIFLVAGELSGDIHGANLIRSLKKVYGKVNLYGTGGKNLLKEGQVQSYTIDDMSIIGFVAVIKSIFKIFKMLKALKEEIIKVKPDIVILVDYPGFNLRLAKSLKGLPLKVVYYIAPQFWVWNYKRIYTLRDYTDLTLSIYPHELKDLKANNVNAKYIGNPVVDNFKYQYKNKSEFLSKVKFNKTKPIIGILPGSRKSELIHLLPKYLKVVDTLKGSYQFVISQADSISDDFMKPLLRDSNVKVLRRSQYDIMKYADYLILCSGTVTLEAGLHLKPSVITYQASEINFFIARRLSKLRMIGLPNIILGKEVMKEVYGGDIKVDDIVKLLNEAIADKTTIVQELKKLKVEFSSTSPSDIGAKEIYSLDSIE